MTLLTRILAALAAGATALSLVAAPPAEAAPREKAGAGLGFQEYVSLGDSWSADVVLADGRGTPDTTHAPIDCAQSHTNYPKLVAAELGIPVHRDATCGSATTDDFYAPQDLPLGGQNPLSSTGSPGVRTW